MQFNVARLLKGSVGTTQQHSLNVVLEPLEDTNTDRVWGKLRLVRVNEGIWLDAALSATASCTCSRCLREFPTSVQFQCDEIYSQLVNIATGMGIPIPDETDPHFTIDDHHELDITEAVRQSVIVALPMEPLCQPSCAGLCPECGANFNESSCACESMPLILVGTSPQAESLRRAKERS